MPKKFLLSEKDIPERWYNILPDLPAPPASYLHPGTLQPMGPEDRRRDRRAAPSPGDVLGRASF
jgi:predicted alternative tryptophan synthase beta-subunit